MIVPLGEMTMLRKLGLLSLCLGFVIACGGSDVPDVEPDTDEFDVSTADQTAIDQAATSGNGAEGTYGYDDGSDVLTITLSTSTFSCGIEVGSLIANVVELSATTMRWTFPDGDGEVTWTRVDNSTEVSIVGVWHTDDPNLYLILSADGSAQLFGDDMGCDNERPRNDDGCIELTLYGATITMDGNLGDWDAVGERATVSDDAMDYVGSDDGADIKALKAEYGPAALLVLLELHNAPSTSFQRSQGANGGTYRLTVKGDNGLSFEESVYYEPGTSMFRTVSQGGEITAQVGANGIEWRVDLSNYDGEQGFENIDVISVEAIDCGGITCQSLDDTDCAYIAVPSVP